MSTEDGPPSGRRRAALVLAQHSAAAGAPPGIDPAEFSLACLSDSYEVLVDLQHVASGVAGEGPEIDTVLWPGAVRLPRLPGIRAVVDRLGGHYDEVVLVPADVPDLPGLVVAKVFQALQKADVCVAPERGGGGGLVAFGVRVPWPAWISLELDLDIDPTEPLQALAGPGARVAVGPDWHRMRTPVAVSRLDPGLEGWEATRTLLTTGSLG